MIRPALALLCLGLIACGPSQAAGVQSPRPTATAAIAPSPGVSPSPGTTPSAASDLPVTAVDFACRLPVVTSISPAGDIATLQGGFIDFPSARIEEDPAGTMQSDGHDVTTTATPVLHGNGFVPFYDRAESRWVPAPASQALPDGSGYAYTTWNSSTGIFTAHVVDVASGNTRSFDLSLSTWDPYVADYRAEGVYLLSASAMGGPGEGVWLLDPLTGNVKQLRQVHQAWAVRDGYAWAARFDPRDKSVWPPVELAPANSMVRIDLATGAETTWFYRAGTYPWLEGLDSYGRPVVLLGIGPSSNEIRLIDHAGSSGVVIRSGDTVGLDYLQGDGDRLWFGNARGIYLYEPSRGFQKVFAYHAGPSTSDRIEPAGFCL